MNKQEAIITTSKEDGRYFAEVWESENAEMPDYATELYDDPESAVDDAEQWLDLQ